MDKQGKALAPLMSAVMPLIPLSYLYARNAEYLNAMHVALVGAILAALSLVGYLLIRLVFRSRFSALAGCATAWVMFFSMKGVKYHLVHEMNLLGYVPFVALFAGVTILLTLAVAFAVRKAKAVRAYPVLAVFLCVMLSLNAIPAVRIGIADVREAGSVDDSAFKTQFSVAPEKPSPNVYWFHCDGMLGFDAFEQYFGDDQADLTRALAQRGFQINRGAMLEVDHTTKIAIPALMNPAYYDSEMRELLKDHETASTLALRTLTNSALQRARINSETRLAFEQKGYQSRTIGGINIYYPPVSDRFYVVTDSSGAYVLETDEGFQDRYLSIIEAGELAILLTGIPSNAYFNTVAKLGARGLLGFPLRRAKLEHPLSEDQLRALAQDRNLLLRTRLMMQAVNDSTYAQRPAFNLVNFLGAHYPFTVDANGEPQPGDPDDIHSYAGQHRYATAALVDMIDLILARDPDAVIVLQADHRLHGQSEAQITAAFGEEAVLPIWNQVMSAMRVPEQYKNGEESAALSNPLNMSRYLINSFVGLNYAYVQ